MVVKSSKVRKDIIPYRAGVVVVTPLDANKKPMYERSVATEYDFLTSTQTSVSHSTETLENGNGQDKTYINDETYTLTVTGNTFNPVFHSTIAGRLETLPDKVLVPEQFTYNLATQLADDSDVLEITFGAGKDQELVPAADKDGNYNFVVEDSYGNVLTKSTKTEAGTYVYDPDSKALQFSEDYKGAAIRVIFWYDNPDALVYHSNPILQQPEFQIDVFGVSMSAGTDEKYKVVTRLLRANISGDLSEQPTQKSKSAPITYTFTSAPVPEGVSVYSQMFVPIKGEGQAVDSIVNGLDDNFGTASGPSLGE